MTEKSFHPLTTHVLAVQGLHHDELGRSEDRRYEDAVRSTQRQQQSTENIVRDSKRRIEDILSSSVSSWASAGAAANRAFMDGLNLAGIEAAVNRAMGLINQANQTNRAPNVSSPGPMPMSGLSADYDMIVPVIGFGDVVPVENASAQMANSANISIPVSIPQGRSVVTNNNHAYPMEFHLHYGGGTDPQDAVDVGRMFADELSQQLRYRGFPVS